MADEKRDSLEPPPASMQHSATLRAPTCPSPAMPVVIGGGRPASFPEAGERIGDFELLSVLGEGAFGKVFLARQISLDRQVALKVSADFGCEARAMATLEHAHIVQVFSETVDPQRGLRFLCMQFVPGTTLAHVIDALNRRDPGAWNGRRILEIIDEANTYPALFEPAGLRSRELLAECGFTEAACWIGARLAEALAYAHQRGVFHRDVKPANVLIDPYGRPMLADFNVALRNQGQPDAGVGLGGTCSYMAPEHLRAFLGQTPLDAVDERSDVYSVGVVLFELLAGKRPFAADAQPLDAASLQAMAAQRETDPPSLRQLRPGVPAAVDGVVRRCLAAEPSRRYAGPAELAQALEGCRRLERMERSLPALGPLTRPALRSPWVWLLLFTLLPHVLSSLVNISYNKLEIVDRLQGERQAEVFTHVLLIYNGVSYSLVLAAVYRLVSTPLRAWRALKGPLPVEPHLLTAARRRALSWPMWAVGLSCLGWLPGGLLFPLTISLAAGPVGADVFGHFLVSFTLSGLIALTYAFFAVQFVALRVLYAHFWEDPRDLPQTVVRELRPVGPRLRLFQVLAGVIPLVGALLFILVGPELALHTGVRFLVAALIVLGMFGFWAASALTVTLSRTLAALTSAE